MFTFTYAQAHVQAGSQAINRTPQRSKLDTAILPAKTKANPGKELEARLTTNLNSLSVSLFIAGFKKSPMIFKFSFFEKNEQPDILFT